MNEELFVTDSKGRKLGIREIDPGDLLDLIEACGPEGVPSNDWIKQAILAASVRSIDGVPVLPAISKQHVRNTLRMLGFHGMDAVREGLRVPSGESSTSGADVELAKN